ncbi:phosphoprotein ECPP44-like [Olea europaea var. sylvestris]|uniref:phosphoprotein ECPP44-like n=1 Tax=Olea europaea var. sylvestris TaxID=158386 RepID=UPI000C1D0DAB|nr:phosphoprotein ECPP44-like [Olea europaea var. sylvestris]
MAEQYPQGHVNNTSSVEAEEHGCFNFMREDRMEEEKTQDDIVMTDFDTGKGSKGRQKHTLMDELQRSHSHSSSSSEEDVEEGGERRKKKEKKGLKEPINDKISEDEGEDTEHKDTSIPVEKCNEEANAETAKAEEKKGFLEKIKEKLPGQHKKIEEGTETPYVYEHSPGSDAKEKKGIMDKIKEKMPGHHNEKED